MSGTETHVARVMRQLDEAVPPVAITEESVCGKCGGALRIPDGDSITSAELLQIQMEFGLVPWPDQVTHLHNCWRCGANLSGYSEDGDEG